MLCHILATGQLFLGVSLQPNTHRPRAEGACSSRAPSVASTLDNGECEICFDNLVEVAVNRCGHQFCSDCVRQVRVSTHPVRSSACLYCALTL